ncbi:MAG: alpha-keto acid decarboxylase family protein [Candidatus Scalindua sp.]|jgi:indolepyruvate decarboxylase|nr:alpha-keto acid decarboxylase family protein [Candidatus Scalindua sp.]MBT5305738.1 alpha-keto acid decarboxylase family protein [Candidatus Scalindua sp.]MBT6052150.1 alpha-keto acid decarboxylase family protein [Candidatus Scalindua sp.]MBT6227599.1 alpha-keto acid decarboxylase family protein [Candidatus Scalindua sp.]MBT7210948.1 alpha-keto acid decarboxylase family protein [Candidatus Scalindua sp.]
MAVAKTIGNYLIQKLYMHGVRHVFGVPGDYSLSFFHELESSDIQVINTCDEQGAGFAADAYARVKGLGAVCVTYCVGGLKITNTTAQAFAEKSPVVVISGAPGTNERIKSPLLHHKVREFDTQFKVFEQITVASTALDNPQTACREIDRVIDAALHHKRPVYIELPRNMVSVTAIPYYLPQEIPLPREDNTLKEALLEATKIINASEKPVIIAGIELHRFGLQEEFLQFIEKTRIPFASTPLSKSVISEHHPQYMGIYEGAIGREEVREYVESSDCLVLLGTFMTDINLGMFTAHLDQGRSIYATSEKVYIHYHTYENVSLGNFLKGLLLINIDKQEHTDSPHPESLQPLQPVTGKKISIKYLFQRLNSFIDKNTVIIADTGDAMFGAMDMTIHRETKFLSPAYYASMGFAVPGSLGAQLANPNLRPLVLVGDGAFQMTGMELSTAARYKLSPIIIILNNSGYGTERPMLDGCFNDIKSWEYSCLPDILKAGRGFRIKTEDQLEEALQLSRQYTEDICILDVQVDSDDKSQALERMTKAMAKRV